MDRRMKYIDAIDWLNKHSVQNQEIREWIINIARNRVPAHEIASLIEYYSRKNLGDCEKREAIGAMEEFLDICEPLSDNLPGNETKGR